MRLIPRLEFHVAASFCLYSPIIRRRPLVDMIIRAYDADILSPNWGWKHLSDQMLTETIIEDSRWQDAGLEALAERAAMATLAHLGLNPEAFEISILGCDDARIAVLNQDFRGKPQPTNVLSWPSVERGAGNDGALPDLPESGPDAELGDIAIAYDTCHQEAREAGKPFTDHAVHLIVHAVLHLLGYDHIRDQDATLMQSTEVVILGKLGLPDPY